jgi:hypothetical protein
VAEQLPEVEILLKRLSSLEAQIEAEVADPRAETARLQARDTPEAIGAQFAAAAEGA